MPHVLLILVYSFAHIGQEYIHVFFNIAQIFRQSDTYKLLPFNIMMIKIIYYTNYSLLIFSCFSCFVTLTMLIIPRTLFGGRKEGSKHSNIDQSFKLNAWSSDIKSSGIILQAQRFLILRIGKSGFPRPPQPSKHMKSPWRMHVSF